MVLTGIDQMILEEIGAFHRVTGQAKQTHAIRAMAEQEIRPFGEKW